MNNPFEILEQMNERLVSIEQLLKVNYKPAPVKNDEPEELLTRNEVINLLKVSEVTVTKWTKEGFLKGYRLGQRVRYKKSEVMSALDLIHTR